VHGGHSYYVKKTKGFPLDHVFAHTSILFCTAERKILPRKVELTYRHQQTSGKNDSRIIGLWKPFSRMLADVDTSVNFAGQDCLMCTYMMNQEKVIDVFEFPVLFLPLIHISERPSFSRFMYVRVYVNFFFVVWQH